MHLQDLKLHFHENHRTKLHWSAIKALYNKWYIFMLFNHVLLLVAVVLKIIFEYKVSSFCYPCKLASRVYVYDTDSYVYTTRISNKSIHMFSVEISCCKYKGIN